MVQYKIKWNEGDGYIVATSEGVGDGDIAFTTDGPNEGLDREQTVTIETTKGNTIESVDIHIQQKGMREPFYAADGLFLSAEGETFNVLKDEYYEL